MSLDKSTVRSIANLARIEVPDSDLDGLARELQGILTWVEQLSAVDTDGVAPIASVVDMTMAWRDDAVTDGGYPDKVVGGAPDPTDHFFTVPKVVE
ncbi:Asp-tRNA(Asn)/Glu-tRNA(Gln) amidotransferase subunit GatC [Roseospirillum parvum]|uniref:Aspartyl/glutamyl-tRNA(Asn/Gln) amidotransferase subunit C n=1 Tax=Roseospirillum parvum TaxID=83401 RepID=A0A1G7TY49_9PROT|nr:Asp-tRNA(Asn)/Glu-tRNA(Gln) amidotransferase subunit GatC [Roseospirillum parvum]SDG39964.1 aspartyl-tRNA(Asn)/glutamyl-tRNA(Gln) amidotransferase subunit C [Roseospirillum parvum]